MKTLEQFEAQFNALGFDVIITKEDIQFNHTYTEFETITGNNKIIPTQLAPTVTLDIALVTKPNYQSDKSDKERFEYAMKILKENDLG